MNDVRTVGAHMTPFSQSIGLDITLAEAQQRMREHATQLLPVVDQGQPCGLLFERDLHVARQLGAAFDEVTVGKVLLRTSFSVKSDESLETAVRAMASRAASHAVVLEDSVICGVLTTHDALRVLAELLEERGGAARSHESRTSALPARSAGATSATPPKSGTWPNEQSGCSLLDAAYLLERVEESAARLMRDAESQPSELRDAVSELHDSQSALLASELHELAETRPDAEPLHRTRLEKLSEERARHTQTLATLLLELDRGTTPISTLAGHALQAGASLRTNIEREREPLRFVS
jgi:CBS domain-containing protein